MNIQFVRFCLGRTVRRIAGACTVLLVGGIAATAAVPAQAQAAPSVAITPVNGRWVSYSGSPIVESASPALQAPCPAGTTNYTGAAQPYSCLHNDLDMSNHPVGIRQGRTGAESSGFGLLHVEVDHNLPERDIELLIQDTPAGIQQAPGSDRYVYGATYATPDGDYISIEVIETRSPSASAPDNYILGLQTGYCREGGMTGPMENCPDDLPPPF